MASYYELKNAPEPISLDVFLDELDKLGDSIFSKEHFDKTLHLLQRLYANREFLLDVVKNYLENPDSQNINHYTSQVFILAERENYTIRAPVWIPDGELVSSRVFAYGLAHDHNFDLLTIGYLGTGYTTYMYSYDADAVTGFKGEDVKLSDCSTFKLTQGSALFMKGNHDIHVQLPPNELSISLNILKSSGSSTKQFEFDIENQKIIRPIRNEIGKSILELSGYFFNDETEGRLKTFSKATGLINFNQRNEGNLLK
ncbi:hypothetical protein SAMN06297229_0243 [Pseudidiomarina planktonica]|uniref:Uncharacterized protein n=1 Tax=Pseudidiomarina planktonica TaxID=1323738 RepID=A0A1Y6E9L9_9GAMM|nr:hypothetical protein [Pseudidiomarina planktonica]RUO66262.1 hypothetical protein CWI77_07530 [Pseudidiomarina planktonica]SMQ59288.1 hypothetical protein SAMN06297229_0243 [Pseudidiomarina planktonica]